MKTMEMSKRDIVPSDRRAIRTRKMVKKAFIELLERKSFHDISITDITEKADINRGTFYLHYVDKYDLLNKVEDEVLEDLMEYASGTSFDGVFELDENNNILAIKKPVPFIKKIFEFFLENQVLAKGILGPNGDSNFQIKLKEFMLERLTQNRFIVNINVDKILIPVEYFISYIMAAHMGVILQWIEDGMKKSPDEMALILTKMFILGPFKVAGINTALNFGVMNK